MARRSAAPSPDQNVWSEYEIQAVSSLSDRPLRNLKHGDAFAVLDAFGDCGVSLETADGLYYRDTRFVSRLEFRIEGRRPLLLISASHENKPALSVQLTNPDLVVGIGEKLSRDTIHITKTMFLRDGVCYARFSVSNFSPVVRRLHLDMLHDADFRDLFEIRGTQRKSRGTRNIRKFSPDSLTFSYLGLDAVERQTEFKFIPEPARIDHDRSTWMLSLEPDEQKSIYVIIAFSDGRPKKSTTVADYLRAYRDMHRERHLATTNAARISTSNEVYEEILARASSDVHTLITYTKHGPFPYAGIPWFNTVFGRDGIITAMFLLWLDPSLAKGVLRLLSATQATRTEPLSDAEPGKILHEMRHGEMANLGEVPFARYYGSVDATPLFVMLAGMYFEQTGDITFIREIWPHLKAALTWIDQFGDGDRDGFVEYERAAESGLANQGWKDSFDAIFDQDGNLAQGPIALCEVQGYVFAAKRHASKLARALGEEGEGERLSGEAEFLRQRFENEFWCEDLQSYALALDGDKKPCRVRASNAGHALFAEIASPERARLVARSLLASQAFSGWGVRTLSAGQPRYNPMSYHNGSVWPHDNAMIALGLARYGMKAEVLRVTSAMFTAARYQELRRLPELFCGFRRRSHLGPTPYPVACSPQAWSAAASFALIGACLGIQLDHKGQQVILRDPVLPEGLDDLEIRNFRLGSSRFHLRAQRETVDVTVSILDRSGAAQIVLVK